MQLPSAQWLVRAGGIAEAVVAVAALATGWWFLALLVAASYLAFALFVIGALRAGKPLSSCGCFGKVDTPPTMVHVVIDLAAVAIAVGVALVAAGIPPRRARRPAARGRAVPAPGDDRRLPRLPRVHRAAEDDGRGAGGPTVTAGGESPRASKGIAITNWLVSKTSGFLERKTSRRGFLIGSAMAGSAVAVTGCQVAVQPGSAYTHITDCGASFCTDGWTEFCCGINGYNACPTGSFPGGWWRADFSSFCNGTRYYIDCMQSCCGPVRSDGFCAGCEECRCASDCGTRRVYCNYFRYGQCHTEIARTGPIACRVVTCVPPYQSDPACINSPAVDNRTAEHAPNCQFNFEPGPPPPPPAPPPRIAAVLPSSAALVVPASGGEVLAVGAASTARSARARS